MSPGDYDDARATNRRLAQQLRQLEQRRATAHPEDDLDGIDEAIESLERQIREGEYI